MKRLLAVTLLVILDALGTSAQQPLDKASRQWVEATLKKMSIEQIVGQMIFAPFDSTYLSSAQIARPDVSLSSVRVSDTVSTNTRARCGATALCSLLLIGRL